MEVVNIKISDIIIKDRMRKDLGSLEELAQSILTKGLIQPITVNKNLELIAGERRIEASRLAGLNTILAIIRDSDSEDSMEVELIENVCRKDMKWDEVADGVRAFHEYKKAHTKDWRLKDTADYLGRSIGGVHGMLEISNLMQAVPEIRESENAFAARKALAKLERRVSIETAREDHKKQVQIESPLKYANSHYKIGDAITGMEELAELYKKMDQLSPINFAEVDPPYGIDLNLTKAVDENNSNFDLIEYNEVDAEEYLDFLARTIKALYNCLAAKAWVVFWFGPTWFHEVKSLLQAVGFIVNDMPGIWPKPYGQTAAPNYNLGNAYEMFFICRKGNIEIVKKGRLNIFDFAPVPPQEKYHPTQRPIDLIKELINTFYYPRGTMIIPFLGSGASLLAAYGEGVPAFGWDLSEDYKTEFLKRVDIQYEIEQVNL